MNANALENVIWDDAAISVWSWRNGSVGIVRPMKDGQFAVIEMRGTSRRIVKILPKIESARRYNLACGN